MKQTRQVRRAEQRKRDKEGTSIESLKNHCIQLAALVGQMQVSLNTMYQIFIQKEVMTPDEFRKKHREIMLAMYPPKPSKSVIKEDAAECTCKSESECVDKPEKEETAA